jgi:hypothetical protein
MLLPSGEFVVLREPERTQVREDDLLRGLAGQRRYAGHVDCTVLQHLALCVLLAREVAGYDPIVVAHCAAHDLHEAYTGDLLRAWKAVSDRIALIEGQWQFHVYRHFGLQTPTDEEQTLVKLVDRRAVAVETDGTRHPQAETFAADHGGPVAEVERECWQRVAMLRPGELWEGVRLAISVGAALQRGGAR